MCVFVMATTMALRIALLPRIPVPQPRVPDEFAYLLGGETFAAGRLTNPAHPMWRHFETLMELSQPTYMSKYPPGQSLFLAIGYKLGHPWLGVWISFGLFAACLCWMLQNWVPPVYALLGTAITVARISVLGYWMNSYWGGTVAASAGCLFLGALPRLAYRVKPTDVLLASLSLVVLANTRPYEGLVMSVAAVVALVFWRVRRKRTLAEFVSMRCVLVLVVVFGAGAFWYAYYNHRVTGHALRMPYAAYFEQYQMASPWIFLPAQAPPIYRHADLRNTWEKQNEEFERKRAHPISNLKELFSIFDFFCSPLFLFPAMLALLLSRSYRLWTAAVILVCAWFGLIIESVRAPHYVAGSVGLFALLAVYGLRWLRVIGKTYGPVVVLTLVGIMCLQGRASEQGQSWETRRISPRMIATQEVMKHSGRHLILVRYSPDHIDRGDECVYNAADIDASQIVWARDMGEAKNQELIDYYRGSRKVWLYQPDTDPAELIPYESVHQ